MQEIYLSDVDIDYIRLLLENDNINILWYFINTILSSKFETIPVLIKTIRRMHLSMWILWAHQADPRNMFLCQNLHPTMNFHYQNPLRKDLYLYHL